MRFLLPFLGVEFPHSCFPWGLLQWMSCDHSMGMSNVGRSRGFLSALLMGSDTWCVVKVRRMVKNKKDWEGEEGHKFFEGVSLTKRSDLKLLKSSKFIYSTDVWPPSNSSKRPIAVVWRISEDNVSLGSTFQLQLQDPLTCNRCRWCKEAWKFHEVSGNLSNKYINTCIISIYYFLSYFKYIHFFTRNPPSVDVIPEHLNIQSTVAMFWKMAPTASIG